MAGRRQSAITRGRATIAAAAAGVTALALALGGVGAADAASNYSGANLAYEQTFFAYANAGELPKFTFTQTAAQNVPVDITITAPDGTVQQTCHIVAGSANGTPCTSTGLIASVAGVWTIHYTPNTLAPNARYTWTVNVVNAQNAVIPGRTWVETYGMYQSAAANIQLWLATGEGYVYAADFRGYSGAGSWIKANGFGLVDTGTCTPLYHSIEGSLSGANGAIVDPKYSYSDACGDPYKLFLERPNADLPATATTPTGTDWVRPAVVPPSATNLALQQGSAASRAGNFVFDLVGVNGGYAIQVDTDGNGLYTDPVDRTIPWGSPPGSISVPFDGLDGQGNALDACEPMNAKVVVDRVGEIHLVLDDVESLGTSSVNNYGIKITGDTPGVVAPNPKLYWNDTTLTPRDSSEKPLPYADGRAGIDTTTTVTGAHGWGQWGDRRSIENWTYYNAQAGATVPIAASCAPGISIVKSATPTDAASYTLGQTIHYSFTVTNTGSAPLTNVAVAETAFSGSGTAPVAVCPASTLAVTAQTICTADYVLTQDDIDAGILTNTAIAEADGAGIHVTSDPSSKSIPGNPAPGIALVKSVTPTTATATGDAVTYAFQITNTGDVTLHDPTVTENLFTGTGTLSAVSCPAGAAILIPGEVQTCTATYSLTQADVDAGRVDNTAAVAALSPTNAPVTSGTSSAAVTIAPAPALALIKSADKATVVGTGQQINYTFGVTNTGNVTVHGLAIAEIAFTGAGTLSAVSCPTTQLAPRDTVDCTASYQTLGGDVTSGDVDNTARATALSPAGTSVLSALSSAAVAVTAEPVPPVTPPGSPPPGGLAHTGSSDPRAALVLAILALAAGLSLQIRRRRRASTIEG